MTINKKHKILLSLLLIIVFAVLIFVFSFKEEKVYTSHEYNSNGQLIGINEYIIRNNDTILQGKFERYNDKGILISKGEFINGHINGKCSYYDDDGKIEEIHFRKNKDITLESTFYNSKGFIQKYISYDYLGNYFFTIHFDEKGVTKYNGYFQIETYQCKFSHPEQFKIKEQQYLKVGDKLKYSYLIANIPNAKRSIKIENMSVDNSKVKRTLKHIEPCQWNVEEVLTKKGKNTI
ncbi:hypothetical protein, partial [Flavobacterium columnare]|uniref:hypothetical protein n=1 Tax=Flavobacterium columnare TaxID=996 RepID=UPI000CF5E5BB